MTVRKIRRRRLILALFVVINGLILLRLIRFLLATRHAPGSGDAPEEQVPSTEQRRAPAMAMKDARRAIAPKARKRHPMTQGSAVGSRRKKRSRLNAENVLLAVEIGAIFLFVAAGIALWQTRQDVNEAYRDLQRSDPRVLPTLIAAANPGMLPDSLAHTGQDRGPAAAPPLPTPFPTSTPNALVVAAKPLAAIDEIEDAEREVEQDVNAQWGTTVVMEKRVAEHDQPRRLQIPSIGVNSFVFQDYGEDWMKLGVVQIAGPAAPGEPGNLVLAAHDDIYGEVFRDLDRLQPGDEISLLGDSESYVYRVRESLIVDPDDVWVTLPTSTPTLTLVSCYPYLINTHRIVVFADLAQ